jgi:hypothetical protein
MTQGFRSEDSDEQPQAVDQSASASDTAHITQAGRDVNIFNAAPGPAGRTTRPSRTPARSARVSLAVVAVITNVILMGPRVDDYDSALTGLVFLLVVGPAAIYTTGIVLYLLSRMLRSVNDQDGLVLWWLGGAVPEALVSGALWTLTLAMADSLSHGGFFS